MSLMNCKKLRFLVMLAFGLFIAGIVLQVPRMLFETTSLVTLISGVGLLAVIVSPLLLVSTTVISLLPGLSQRLKLCNH